MSEHEGARVTALASIVSVEPSQYYVGEKLVASHIIAWLLDETRPHESVLMTRQQTITTGTLISHVQGAPPGGVGKHSGGAAGGPCKFLRHGGERGQVSVLINGKEVVAEGDWYDMDCGPNGGNVVGLFTYVVPVGSNAYVDTATGEIFEVGKEEPVVDNGASPNAPGIGIVGPTVKMMAGVYEATLPPMWDAAMGMGRGAMDAGQYLATHTKQDWWNDGAPVVANAGAAAMNAVTHPGDTLWGAYEMGRSAVSGQVEAFYVDPATTTGHWVGNVLNAYMLAKDGITAFNALKEWRAARAAEALAEAARAEREAQALAEAARLAEASRLAEAERLAEASRLAGLPGDAAPAPYQWAEEIIDDVTPPLDFDLAQEAEEVSSPRGVKVTKADEVFSESQVPEDRLWNDETFRGERRSPDEIKAAGGFMGIDPQGQVSLADHMYAERPPSQWISTSQSYDVATQYAFMPNGQLKRPGPNGSLGYTYYIDAPGGVNVNTFGVENSKNLEVAYSGGIPWKNVVGWKEHVWTGDITSTYYPNPDFAGPPP